MSRIPAISRAVFAETLEAVSPEPLSEAVVEALFVYYEELRRWAPRMALIGPGTADEVLRRHFGESLAALPLIPPVPPEGSAGQIVDVGSGGGFPGMVLAAARPGWRVTLVEARQKKWAFLMSVARKAALSCRCLNARVGDPLPEGIPGHIGLLTARAIRLPAGDLGLLLDRMGAAGRGLFWAGVENPDLPAGYSARTALSLQGSESRRIVEIIRQQRGGAQPGAADAASGSPEP